MLVLCVQFRTNPEELASLHDRVQKLRPQGDLPVRAAAVGATERVSFAFLWPSIA